MAPDYIATLPPDIIGGAPLHYHRTDDGQYRLYSIGWNETDDQGQADPKGDFKKGDWVWNN